MKKYPILNIFLLVVFALFFLQATYFFFIGEGTTNKVISPLLAIIFLGAFIGALKKKKWGFMLGGIVSLLFSIYSLMPLQRALRINEEFVKLEKLKFPSQPGSGGLDSAEAFKKRPP